MEIYKTNFSRMYGKTVLDKFFINYDDKHYSELYNYLCGCENMKTDIIKNKSVVLKFSSPEITENEYNISLALQKFPNYIKFLNKIKCNDDILNLEKENNKINLTYYKIHNLGIKYDNLLVMDYYELGSLNSFNWNKTNLDVVMNIVKQVIYASLYSYLEIGFLHNNLHSANVLLKPKTTDKICYGTKELILKEYEVIIMDYNFSKINPNNIIELFFGNIAKFLVTLEGSLLDKDIDFYYDDQKIYDLLNSNDNINYYDEIEKIIDTFKLEIYIKKN